MKKQSKILIAAAAAIAAITVIIVAAAIAVSGSAGKYENHLDMAQQYLDELNYEQAVAELRMAIEIEPDNSKVYFALAEVYVAMGDYESAIAVLEEGYAATGDAGFTEHIAGLEAEITQQRKAQFYSEYEGLRERINEINRWNSTSPMALIEQYLTQEEREQAYRGFAEELEEYIADVTSLNMDEDLSEDGLYGWYQKESSDDSVTYCFQKGNDYYSLPGAYLELAGIYLYLNDLENCLRVRTELAEYTGRPEIVQDGNAQPSNNNGLWGNLYDKYGRIISGPWVRELITYEYREAQYAPTYVCVSMSEPDVVIEMYFTYENGRITSSHAVDNTEFFDQQFSYSGNGSVVITETSSSSFRSWMLGEGEHFYDMYGFEIRQ